MPIIKSATYPALELELTLSCSSYFSPPAELVTMNLTFRFGKHFPEFTLSRDCDEVGGIRDFIKDLKDIGSGKSNEIDYTPLEPEFMFTLRHSGKGKYEKDDNFLLNCWVDVPGSVSGNYSSEGFSIDICVRRNQILEFANALEQELNTVEKQSRESLQ